MEIVSPPSSSSGGFAGVYGDGSDGNVTVTTTVTLTRDMFYDTLTVQNGGRVKTSGYRVFCKTACVVQTGGSIDANGANGAAHVGGGGTGNNQASLGYSLIAGATGTATTGGAGTNVTSSMGGSGGAGGAVGANAGGAGGTAALPVAALGSTTIRSVPQVLLGIVVAQVNGALVSSGVSIMGGANGGAGRGDGTNFGGGGGAGGAVVMLAAKAITNSGAISANGGLGAANGAGGGGGGGGGVVFCVCDTYTGTQPTATGGTGGAGQGTGSAGSAGSDGRVILLAASVS